MKKQKNNSKESIFNPAIAKFATISLWKSSFFSTTIAIPFLIFFISLSLQSAFAQSSLALAPLVDMALQNFSRSQNSLQQGKNNSKKFPLLNQTSGLTNLKKNERQISAKSKDEDSINGDLYLSAVDKNLNSALEKGGKQTKEVKRIPDEKTRQLYYELNFRLSVTRTNLWFYPVGAIGSAGLGYLLIQISPDNWYKTVAYVYGWAGIGSAAVALSLSFYTIYEYFSLRAKLDRLTSFYNFNKGVSWLEVEPYNGFQSIMAKERSNFRNFFGSFYLQVGYSRF